jgi:hypothetical protein
MFVPPFCPYAACRRHVDPPATKWWQSDGFHSTFAFGEVPRFRCKTCGRTFSVQTFSVHYYAKKVIPLAKLEELSASSVSTRALSRTLGCSCGTVTNRIDRIARQGIKLHTTLRKLVRNDEGVCFDGLVSFAGSQYYPDDIGISITKDSRFVLGLSYATLRRSGVLRPEQKKRRDQLYEGNLFERKAVERSFNEHLDMLQAERLITRTRPLIIISDEKKEYRRALVKHSLYRKQDEDHRVAQIQVWSKLARTYYNPLFASNYIDREIRKDQANHRRETTCFARNAANGMCRLYSYLVLQNYQKKYLIKWPEDRKETHAEIAGLDVREISRMRAEMFSRRAFLSHLTLLSMDRSVWTKTVYDPRVGGRVSGKLPAFAFA